MVRSKRDFAVVIAIMAASCGAVLVFDLADKPLEEVHELAHKWLEIVFLILVMGMTLMWFSLRRHKIAQRAIDGRLHAEEAVQKSRDQLRQVIDLVPHMIFAKDWDGQFLLANQAVAEAYGTTVEALSCASHSDLHKDEKELKQMLEDDREVMQAEKPKSIPSEIFTDAHGQKRILQTVKIPYTTSGVGEGQRAMLGIAIDITERVRIDDALKRREATLEAIANASERFLRSASWESQAPEVLNQIGIASGVDRAYVFENFRSQEGGLCTRQRFEWAAPGITPQISNEELQALNYQTDGFGRWEEMLGRGDAIVGQVKDFPVSEQDVLLPQDIVSIVAVPIFSGQTWWGFIGFDACCYRQWNTAKIDMLKAVAGTFGAAIQRQQVEAALDQTRQELEERVEARTGELSTTNDRLRKEIVERCQTELALKQKNEFLRLMQVVVVSANEAENVEEVFHVMLGEVCRHMGWPVGHVYLSTEGGKRLEPSTLWHSVDPQRFEVFRKITEKTPFEVGEGLPGRVLATGKPAWISDVTHDSNFPRARLAKNIGVRAGFAFPVLVGTEVAAVLEFFSPEVLEPDEPLLEIMAYVGTQLGRVIERTRAEKALRNSVDRFDLAVKGTRDGLWDAWISPGDLFNPRNSVYYSSRFKELLGFEKDEFEGVLESWSARLHPDDHDRVFEALRSHFEDRVPYDIEYRMAMKSGEYRWFIGRGQAVWDEQGRPVRMSGSFTDINARKLAQEALQRNEQRYRAMYDDNPSMYFTLDGEGTVINVNTFGAEQLGYTPDQLIGQPVLDIVYSEDRQTVMGHLATCLAKPGEVCRWEFRKVCADGRVIWVKETTRSVPGNDGQWMVLIVCEEITRRKQIEALQYLQRTVLEKVAVGSPLSGTLNTLCSMVEHMVPGSIVSVLLVDADAGCLRFAAGPSVPRELAVSLDGLVPAEGAGPCANTILKGKWTVVEDISTDPMCANVRGLMQKYGITTSWSVPIVSQGKRVLGSFFMAHLSSINLNTVHEEVLETASYLAGIAVQRTYAEQELRRSEEKFRQLVETTRDWVWEMDENATYTYASPRVRDILGYQPEEVVGKTPFELMPPEEAERVAGIFSPIVAAREPFSLLENINRHKDGRLFVLETSGTPVFDDQGVFHGYRGMDRDVTQRKEAEAALRASEQRYRSIFDNAAVGIAHVDLDGRFLQANAALCKIFGYSSGELSNLRFIDVTHPNDRRASIRSAKKLILGGVNKMAFDKRYVCKDGAQVLCRVSVTMVGRPSGREKYFVAILEDITDQMRAQEQARQHQEELAHVARLNTVGELAAGLAHELNQPLAAISNYVQACAGELRAGCWDHDELVDTMERASSQCRRASEIIRRLRNFISKREPKRATVDVNRVVHEALDLIKPDARLNKVKISLQLHNNLRSVDADSIQIEQVVLNLARNSLDAMRGDETRRRELVIKTYPLGSRSVQVMVTDTGCGLPNGESGKVFNPFFTTKPYGMGMGLSISRSIVEAHGGRLVAQPNIGRGATFHFTLPTV